MKDMWYKYYDDAFGKGLSGRAAKRYADRRNIKYMRRQENIERNQTDKQQLKGVVPHVPVKHYQDVTCNNRVQDCGACTTCGTTPV